MHPYTLLAVSGLALLGWTLLLVAEARHGARVLEGARTALDRAASATARAVGARLPELNRHFAQQFFHYVVHLALSFMLSIIRTVERGVHYVAQVNRSRAVSVREPRADSHLSQVLAHKEETALTEEEKVTRRDAALQGGGKRKRPTVERLP